MYHLTNHLEVKLPEIRLQSGLLTLKINPPGLAYGIAIKKCTVVR
jgi:hypothetical protein